MDSAGPSGPSDPAGIGGSLRLPQEAGPFRLPVYVAALVVCQDAFKDDRGRTHIHAVFDNLNATGFPVNAQFMVWCSVKGRGTATLVVKVIDTLETTLAVTGALVAEVTPFKGHEFFFGFTIGFAGAGLYKIIAYLDGIPALEAPLVIRHAPAPPAVKSDG